MQNLFIKSLVLTAVVAGCGVVLWQAQKGLQTASEKPAPQQFNPLPNPAQPDKVAAKPVDAKPSEKKADDELLLPKSFMNSPFEIAAKPAAAPASAPPFHPGLAEVKAPPVQIEEPKERETQLQLQRPDAPIQLAAHNREATPNYEYYPPGGRDPKLAALPLQEPEKFSPATENKVESLATDLFGSPEPEAKVAQGPVGLPGQDEKILPREETPRVAAQNADDLFGSETPAKVPEPTVLPLVPVQPESKPLQQPGNAAPALAENAWSVLPREVKPEAAPANSPGMFPGEGLFGQAAPKPLAESNPARLPQAVPLGQANETNPLSQFNEAKPFARTAGAEEPNTPDVMPSLMHEPKPLPERDGVLNPLPQPAPEPLALPSQSREPVEIPPPPLPPANTVPNAVPVPEQGDLFPSMNINPAPAMQIRPLERADTVPRQPPAQNEPSTLPIEPRGNSRSLSDPQPSLLKEYGGAANNNRNDPRRPVVPAAGDPLRDNGPVTNLSQPAELPIPSGPQSPELKIEKIAPPQAVVGEPVVYSIVVRNVGGSPARDVVVEDRVPKGAELDGTIPQAFEKEAGRLTWTLGTLAPGEQREIKLRVIPVQAGQIGSVATVSFAAAVTASIKVTAPQVKISMQGPAEAVLGERITFNLTLKNEGEGNARDVWLRAKLPDGLRHPEGTDVELHVGSLMPGMSHSVQLVLQADKLGIVTPLATATNDGRPADSVSSDVKIIRERLQITRTSAENGFVGRPAPLVTRVKNESMEALRNVTVTEQLDARAEIRSVSHQGQYDARTRQIAWRIPVLQPGDALDLQYEVLSNTAGRSESLIVASDAAGNRAELKSAMNVLGFADLAMDVNTQSRVVNQGEQVSLRLTLKNDGTAAARDVRTRFSIPQGWKFINARGPAAFRQDGQAVVFDSLQEVPLGTEQSYDIVLTAASAGPATVMTELQTADDSQPLRRDQKIQVLAVRP